MDQGLDSLSFDSKGRVTFESLFSTYGLVSPLRLSDVQASFEDGSLSFESVVDLHDVWRKQPEYCVLAFANGSLISPNGLGVNGLGVKYEDFDYWAFKVAKRGNAGHKARVYSRFKPLINFCDSSRDFRFIENKARFGSTSAVMVTLTAGVKVCDSCKNHFKKSLSSCPVCGSAFAHLVTQKEAWANVGSELNVFLASLRQKYGKISVLRSFEIYSNGLPHVHLIVLFHDTSFFCTRHFNKKSGNFEYLLPSVDKKAIECFWHSYVKNVGVTSLGGVMYTAKYIFSGVFGEKSRRTLVACWLFGKRQYSISSDFLRTLVYMKGNIPDDVQLLDSLMHISNKKPFLNKVCFHVGVKFIPNSGDFLLLRVKPPPDIDFPADFYDSHDSWLEDFSVSDTRCSLCGNPIFFDSPSADSYIVDEDGKTLIVCSKCLSPSHSFSSPSSCRNQGVLF